MSFNVTFNGVNIPSFINVRAVDFTVLLDITHGFKQVAGGIGLLEAGTAIGGKVLKLKIQIIPDTGKSLTDMARELAYWVRGNNFKTASLVISDEATMTYQAKINSSIEITDLLFAGEGELDFIVPSGIAVSSVAVPVVVGTNIVVTYNGTAPTYPVITWTVAGTLTGATLNLTCVETGDTASITGSFVAGNIVVIDCKRKLVSLNGVTTMGLVNFSSKWITLPSRGTYNITKSQAGTFTCTCGNNWF